MIVFEALSDGDLVKHTRAFFVLAIAVALLTVGISSTASAQAQARITQQIDGGGRFLRYRLKEGFRLIVSTDIWRY